jgi:sugar diacid utilization regulator
MSGRGFGKVLGEFERRRDELAAEIAEIIVAEIPAYAGIADPKFNAELRRAIGEHEDALVAYLRAGRPLEPADLEYVRRSAADRARIGLPISDYLRALRLGQLRLWEELLAIAGERSAALLADTTRNVMEYIDYAAVIAADAYLAEQQALVADGDRVRRDLLEDLLLGREPSPGPCRAAARAAGLDWSAPCLLILAVVERDVEEHAVRRAAGVLERSVAERVRPLVVVRQHEIVIVRAVAKQPVRLARPLQEARRTVHEQGADLSIGVSTIQASPADLPTAYAEASLAVDLSRHRGGTLALADLRTFEYLTLRADETAGRLVRPEIRAFAVDDASAGGIFADTLREYVAADLNVRAAAERLGIHVNTAHYRLGRIADKSGCDLRRLDDIVDLMVAVRLAAR